MKFSQLIECDTRNIFLVKSYPKCVTEELFTDPLLKNQNWAYLRSVVSSFIQLVFIVSQAEGYQLSFRPLAFTSFKAFLKNKKRFGRTSLPSSYSA